MAANTLWGVLAGLSGVAQGASQGFDAYTKNRQTDERIALDRQQAARQEENQRFMRSMTLGNALRDVQEKFGRGASIDPATGKPTLPNIAKEIGEWGALPEGVQGPPAPALTIADVLKDPTYRATAADQFGTVGGRQFTDRQKAEDARTLAGDKIEAAINSWGQRLEAQQKSDVRLADSKAEERALRLQIARMREGGGDKQAGDRPGKDLHVAADRYARGLTAKMWKPGEREEAYSYHYDAFIASGGKVGQIPKRTVTTPKEDRGWGGTLSDYLFDRAPKGGAEPQPTPGGPGLAGSAGMNGTMEGNTVTVDGARHTLNPDGTVTINGQRFRVQ